MEAASIMSAKAEDLHSRLPSRLERETAIQNRRIHATSAADEASVSLRPLPDERHEADIVLAPRSRPCRWRCSVSSSGAMP